MFVIARIHLPISFGCCCHQLYSCWWALSVARSPAFMVSVFSCERPQSFALEESSSVLLMLGWSCQTLGDYLTWQWLLCRSLWAYPRFWGPVKQSFFVRPRWRHSVLLAAWIFLPSKCGISYSELTWQVEILKALWADHEFKLESSSCIRGRAVVHPVDVSCRGAIYRSWVTGQR